MVVVPNYNLVYTDRNGTFHIHIYELLGIFREKSIRKIYHQREFNHFSYSLITNEISNIIYEPSDIIAQQ